MILSFCILIAVFLFYRLFFWSFRDYYYQLKYGIVVDSKMNEWDRALYHASIKKLTAKELIPQIDSNYFELRGYLDWVRIPMVYPYVMNFYQDISNNSNYSGKGCFLTNADKMDYGSDVPGPEDKGGTAYMNDAYGSVLLENIIAFSFNEKYIIGKKASEFENYMLAKNAIISYFIFEFGTNQIKQFKTYQELIEETKRVNYKKHRSDREYTRLSKELIEENRLARAAVLATEESELLLFMELYNR